MNAIAKQSPPSDWRSDAKTLVFAIGNSGRQDDGLGWAFGELLESSKDFKGTIVYRYQLQVEDAELIRDFQRVVFVDATKVHLPTGAAWQQLKAAQKVAFSTHALTPDTVLGLAQDLYGVKPEAWVLAIAGIEWDLETGLSLVAARNLERAWKEAF